MLYRAIIYILKTLLYTAVIVVIIGVILLTFLLFPIEDQGQFLWFYLQNITIFSLYRIAVALVIIPLYGGALLEQLKLFKLGKAIINSIIITPVILTFFIGYHFGRSEAYKIITGYEFSYRIERTESATPHKYLGKINDYDFFLEDKRYMSHNVINHLNIDASIDTIKFNSIVSIINKDSLKSVTLRNYSVNNIHGEDEFVKKHFTRFDKPVLNK